MRNRNLPAEEKQNALGQNFIVEHFPDYLSDKSALDNDLFALVEAADDGSIYLKPDSGASKLLRDKYENDLYHPRIALDWTTVRAEIQKQNIPALQEKNQKCLV